MTHLATPLGSALADRTNRRVAWALFFLCSALFVLTAPGRIDIVDGAIRLDVARNLLDQGKPVISHMLPAVQNARFELYAYYQLGSSLLALPFVLAARWLLPGSLDAEQFAFTLAQVPFAAATVALVFLIYRRLGLSLRSAVAWALALGFGTMIWVYSGSSFDMCTQAFCVTVGVVFGAEALVERSRRFAVGSALAFFVLATVQETYVILAGSLAATLWGLPKERRRELLFGEPARIIGLGILTGALSVLVYNQYRFDNPLSTGREFVGHALLGHPGYGLVGLLFSPAKSIFLYSPLHLLGLVGLWRLRRERPSVGGPALWAFCIQLVFLSFMAFWPGDWAWGPRYLVATTPLVLLGAPFAWRERPRARQVVVGVALLVQLASISVDHHIYYLRHRFRSHFWLIQSVHYEDSPLLQRPREIADLFRSPGYRAGMKLVPGSYDPPGWTGPQPDDPPWLKARLSVKPLEARVTTTNTFPPLEHMRTHPNWMTDYYVLNAPRAWAFWSAGLPAPLRPVPLLPWILVPLAVALAAAVALLRALPKEVSAGTRTGS